MRKRKRTKKKKRKMTGFDKIVTSLCIGFVLRSNCGGASGMWFMIKAVGRVLI